MIAMQYKIALEDDFDMQMIEKRIRENGYKTNGLEGLIIKLYLVQRREKQGKNCYAPFYIWKSVEGMNRFLLDGMFDNIIRSFRMQRVTHQFYCSGENLNFDKCKYLVIKTLSLDIKESMQELKECIESELRDSKENSLFFYSLNPQEMSVCTGYTEYPEVCERENVYEIVYISR